MINGVTLLWVDFSQSHLNYSKKSGERENDVNVKNKID